MRSSVNIIVILLTLGYLIGELDSTYLNVPKHRTNSWMLGSSTRQDFARKLKRPVSSKNHRPSTAISTRDTTSATERSPNRIVKIEENAMNVTTKTNKLAVIHNLDSSSESGFVGGGTYRRHKRKRYQAMLALLLAYKLKFAALIPAIAGGLILLVSTTTLAGFFFALFAAVLGLKSHS